MTDREFEDAVREMRRHQKAFFATRSTVELRRSKILESKVDTELELRAKRDDYDNNPHLFDL